MARDALRRLLLLALQLALTSTSSHYTFRATLRDAEIVGEARADGGALTLLAAPPMYGSGVGGYSQHETRPEIVAGALKLYVYTMASQPADEERVRLLCVPGEGGSLRGCVFEDADDGAQLGEFRAVPLPERAALFGRALRPVQPAWHARLPRYEPAAAAVARRATDWAAHRVGAIDRVWYIPDWLSAAEAAAVEAQLAASDESAWTQMSGRRVLECGSVMAGSGRGLLREALPPWLTALSRRLVGDGAFPPMLVPNSVAVNEYAASQGIAPHADGPIYAPRVAIVSLGSPALFYFYSRQPELRSALEWDPDTDTPRHAPDGPPLQALLLQPNSLLLFDGDAFSVHCHAVDAPADGVEVAGEAAPLVNGHLAGIESGDRIVRGRRVSLTIRYLLDFLLDPDAYRPLGPGESWPG